MTTVFEEKNISKAIMRMGLPAMLGQLTTLIYNIADIYKKEKSVSYEMFTGMLHTTHQDMSQQEIDYINFLSSVDYYADKEK